MGKLGLLPDGGVKGGSEEGGAKISKDTRNMELDSVNRNNWLLVGKQRGAMTMIHYPLFAN